MISDRPLTPHFSLYELTKTNNAALQERNRDLLPDQIEKLTDLAKFAENLRAICGGGPLRIHSGYRSPDLNGATHGSSSTSQHPRCEAIDFDVPGQTIEQSFGTLLMAARTGKLKFGQLIIEEAKRDYGVAQWVHASVIGTLDPEKVGEVMRMQAGPDGEPHYQFVCKLQFSEVA